jgi:hypothetical protein
MMVDTRVYGYIGDGFAVHADCLNGRITDESDLTALFSHMDEDNRGLSCDTCGGWIFEPYPEGIALEIIEDALRYAPADNTTRYSAARDILAALELEFGTVSGW